MYISVSSLVSCQTVNVKEKETHLGLTSYQILKGEKTKNFKCGDCNKVYISVSSLAFIPISYVQKMETHPRLTLYKILKGEAHQAIVVLSSGLKQFKSCETNKIKSDSIDFNLNFDFILILF